MSWLAPGLVVLGCVAGLLGWRYPVTDPGSVLAPARQTPPQPWRVALIVATVLLQTVALPAAVLWPVDGSAHGVLVVAVTVAAVVGGGPVTVGVLRLAERNRAPTGQGTPLQGGRVIGVLERALVAVCLLAGWPPGIAIVMAIKGLGRYPELRNGDGASERFIVGTLASVLWAVGCAGTVLLTR